MVEKDLLILALGSNLGDRKLNLEYAIIELKNEIGNWLANSPIYETEPQGVGDGHQSYLNMVMAFSANINETQLLKITQDIELGSGRKSKGDLKPRTLDIDIIWYGRRTMNSGQLQIPHPRFWSRPFVTLPLLDVLPYFSMTSLFKVLFG